MILLTKLELYIKLANITIQSHAKMTMITDFFRRKLQNVLSAVSNSTNINQKYSSGIISRNTKHLL